MTKGNLGVQLQNLAQETILNIQNLIENQADSEAYETLVTATFKELVEINASKTETERNFLKEVMNFLNSEICSDKTPQVTHQDGYKDEYPIFIAKKLFIDKKAQSGLDRKGKAQDWEKFKTSITSLVLEPQPTQSIQPTQTSTRKPDNTARPASKSTKTPIDLTKYIELATALLNGDTWEKIAVGLSIATFRRDCEIGIDMDFEEDGEYDYAIRISTPAKKEDRNKIYRVPTLVKGTLVIDALERLRDLLPKDSNAQKTRDLEGRKAGNVAWNNSENKKVTKVYNDEVRSFLKDGTKDNKHQLRNIGTSFLFQLHRSFCGLGVGDDKDSLEWTRRCLVHEFAGTTEGYKTWNIENIPEYLKEILDYDLGEIEATEEVTEENKGDNSMANLLQQILANISDNPEAVQLAQKAFLGDDGTIKKGNDLALALGRVFKQAVGTSIQDGITIKTAENPKSAETWSRLYTTIKTLMEYNAHTEKDLRIEIAASPIRSFYEIMYAKTVNINDVNNFLAANEMLHSDIAEHNKEREILPGHNLKWRKKKETVVTNFKTYIK